MSSVDALQKTLELLLRKWKPALAGVSSVLVLIAFNKYKQRRREMLYCDPSPNQIYYKKPIPTKLEKIVFDYIVVGAGSAGCVVASRLAEDPNVTVLLLEAGGDDLDNPEIAIPAGASRLPRTFNDWGFSCETEPNINNRVIYWPRGKVLGGCSSINWMLYVRGNKEDFEYWSKNGCPGWSYEEVLEYYKKSEDREGLSKPTKYHGKGGPLKVSDSRYNNTVINYFIEGAQQAGIKKNDDYNGEDQFGVSKAQFTINNGSRANTYSAFIRPYLKKNLTVVTHALASRVIIKDNKATGVAFINGWDRLTPVTVGEVEVFAKREVILAGGAVNSPQLLLLSGIGPRQHLEELNIPVIKDLPVGLNMQDHILFPMTLKINKPYSITEKQVTTLSTLASYILFKRGLLSSQHLETMVFHKTRDDIKWADLQIHFSNGVLDSNLAQAFGIPVLTSVENGLTALPTLLHPRSLGYVKLRSRNPADPPIIKNNYLSDPEDRRVLIEAYKLAKKIFETPAFKDISDGIVVDPTIPYPPHSDEYILEYVKRYCMTVFHPVGTCRMGAVDDPNTVTDSQLRVKGIPNLRVIDASIMPEIISGNTNAPAIMIGEKGSDLIKATWKSAPAAKL